MAGQSVIASREAFPPKKGPTQTVHGGRGAKTHPGIHPEVRTPRLVKWIESFLYAGMSALLLLIANLFADHWYLSLVALTPFLARVSRADGEEGARLGFLMGLCYLTVSSVTVPSPTAAGWWLTIVTGTALFTLCGWSMGWARTTFGFRPPLVAVLWIAFEFGYSRISHSAGLLGQPALSDPYLKGLVALFGFVAVSTLVVLVNSLLVLAFKAVASLIYTTRRARSRKTIFEWFALPISVKPSNVFLIPESRGPPISLLW